MRDYTEEMPIAVLNLEYMQTLMDALRSHHEYSFFHQQRVMMLATAMGKMMGLENGDMVRLAYAAWLHDIGKIKVPRYILDKPGSLTDAEYYIVKQHAIWGAEMLEGRAETQVLEAIRHHHEREDGSGYPYGLKAHEVPLFSKVIAVCDSFDAMTSWRIYAPVKTISIAIEEIKELAGKKYDRDVVSLFLSVVKYICAEWGGWSDAVKGG